MYDSNIFFRYCAGTIGCIWFIFWVLIVREGPEKDKHISKDELQYIQNALGTTKKPDIKHPWKDIFTSKAVYAISASHFAENWGFYTLLTQLPTFLKGNRKQNPSFKILCVCHLSQTHSGFNWKKPDSCPQPHIWPWASC